MGKKAIEKDTRRLIRDPISIQRHERVKADYVTVLAKERARFKDYPHTQSPSEASLVDLACSLLAFKYSLRKHTVENIIRERYRYEEVEN